MAQLGHFKSEGRGQFDAESLRIIHNLMQQAGPVGLKSRFSHPTMSDDGLGTFLGRARNPQLEADRVRADLHLDPSAFSSPRGDLGSYVMDLAESDPAAISSSLVLKTDRIEILDDQGRPKKDDKGKPIPPIWRPTRLHASDIVDTGDAVDGLLSHGVDSEDLPLAVLWKAEELLSRVFPGEGRDVVEARLTAWVGRYLDRRYGPSQPRVNGRDLELYARLLSLGTIKPE